MGYHPPIIETQMERNLENEMEAGILQLFIGIRASLNKGSLCWVPEVRMMVYWGLYLSISFPSLE